LELRYGDYRSHKEQNQMNLEMMELPQLVDLKRQVDKAINTFETRKKADALAELVHCRPGSRKGGR